MNEAKKKPLNPPGMAVALLMVLGMTKKEFEIMAKEIWNNLSNGYTLICTGFEEDMQYSITDTVTGSKYRTTKAKCLAATAAFIVMKIQGEFPGIIVESYNDSIGYDSDAADAIAQLACLGEVVYG